MAVARRPRSNQGDMVGNAVKELANMGANAYSGLKKNRANTTNGTNGMELIPEEEGNPYTPEESSMLDQFRAGHPETWQSDNIFYARGGLLPVRSGHRFDVGGTPSKSASPYSALGKAINTAGTMAAKGIGNTIGDKNNPWTDNVRTTAYGDNTDNPLFARSTRTNTNALSNDLTTHGLFHSQSNSAAGVMNDINDKARFSSNVADASFGKKAAGLNNNVLRGAGWGAEVGSNFGPYGMAIGAIAGAVGGLGRGIGNLINGKKRLKQLNSAIDARNNYTAASVNTAVDNLGKKTYNQAMTNFAYNNGGCLQPAVGSALRGTWAARGLRPAHRFDDGGSVSNAKGQFRTGVTEFNVGGTHEENPNGGIPQGVAPDGQPNLVEQGEVKLSSITGKDNNYILSNRIVIEQDVAEEFGIDSKYVGETFAAAFKKAYKPLKERPNDPIARNELASLTNKFQGAQEAIKARQEEAAAQDAMRNPSDDTLQMMGEQAKQAGIDAVQGNQGEEQMPQEGAPEEGAPEEGMPQEGMPQDGGMPQEGMPQGDPMAQMMPQGQQGMPQSMPIDGATPMAQRFAARGGLQKHKFARGGRMAHAFRAGGRMNNDDWESERERREEERGRLEEAASRRQAEWDEIDKLNEEQRKKALDDLLSSDSQKQQPTTLEGVIATGEAPFKGLHGFSAADVISLIEQNAGVDEDARKLRLYGQPKLEEKIKNGDADVVSFVNKKEAEGAKPSKGGSVTSSDGTTVKRDENTPEQVETDQERLESEKQNALEIAARRAKDFHLKEHYNNAQARYAPVFGSLYGMVDKDRYINPDKYTRYDYESMRRLHDDPQLISGYQRSKLINPEAMAHKLRAQGASQAANAARVSGGNPSLAAASSLAAHNSTASQLGDAFLAARQFNNTARQADNQFNSNINERNANIINTVNAQNDTHRTQLRSRIEDTIASADSANKATRMNAFETAMDAMGNFGKDELDNAKVANMATHGLIGQGYSSERDTLNQLNNYGKTQRDKNKMNGVNTVNK